MKASVFPQTIISVIFGFVGGVLASVFIFGLNKLPLDVIEKGHPLISAPFLAFVLIIAFLMFFYNPLNSLLSKGNLTLKWGDKEISLSEIEKNVDVQFHAYESRLADLDVELRQIKVLLGSEDNQAATFGASLPINATELGRIKAAMPWAVSDQMALLVYHLGNSQFEWRSQDTISHKTGFHPQVIDDLVASVPEHVNRSRSKFGKVIYRLSDKAKGQFIQINVAGMTRLLRNVETAKPNK